jgi:AraC-like DNA-binding protein
MDIPAIYLYKTRMILSAIPTRVVESFHYLQDPRWDGTILTIRRAGLIMAGPDYGVERSELQGDDLIYCISGAGQIQTGGSWHEISAGQLGWLVGSLPHAHSADPHDPWTVLWLRLDGPQLEAWRTRLLGNGGAVVTITQGAVLAAWFQRLFACLRRRAPDCDLVLNALGADLLILLDGELRGISDRVMPAPIVRLTQAMSARPDLRWNEGDMQTVACISAAQLRRLFQQHMQTTPRAWLRRERILLAQELLLTPDIKVASVAEACGFADIYHFSREFKKCVGQAPRTWRHAEIGRPGNRQITQMQRKA